MKEARKGEYVSGAPTPVSPPSPATMTKLTFDEWLEQYPGFADHSTTYSVDGCVHDWPPDRAGLRKCRRCGVRVLGSLAHNPPARGIDWSHTVIINMAPEEKTT